MAEVIVGPLLSKLKDVALTEAKALAAVGGEIETLSDKLMWLQALVHEADLRSRQDGSRLVRVLACQMREVAFEAEDAVDEFYLKGDLSRRFALAQHFGRNWARAAMEFIVQFQTHFCVRFALKGRIQAMNARVEEIINNSHKHGMSDGSSTDGMTWRASRSIPPMRDHWENNPMPFQLVGYQKERAAELIEKLKQDGAGSANMIRVVGAAGMGKTALLKVVCEETSIKEHFDVVVHLSLPPGIGDRSSSVKQIVERTLDAACSSRKKTRQDARCLVVVDGHTTTIGSTMWSEVGAKEGSKILVSQASLHGHQRTDGAAIQLRNLGREDSKRLFNHVVGLGGKRRSDYATATMNEIRDNIEAITQGAPLAVVLLAKFMSTIPYSKWREASTYIKRNREDDSLRTILSVCIDDLPDELKSCLLYTAGLPVKKHIDAHTLVRLWMAEGFLTQNQGLEAEQLGQCYLKELVYRGLLQLISKTSSADGGRVESVALHEQIHPLVREEARRTSFMDVHYGGSIQPPANTRRLAYMYKSDDGHKKLFSPPTSYLGKLRTLVSFSLGDDHDHCSDHEIVISNPADPDDNKKQSTSKEKNSECILDPKLLLGSPFLRVIHLENGLDNKSKLPDEIGEMVHLHYLGVRCRSLTTLPKSIGNLGRLQTVDVRGTAVTELPKSFWKIPTLRHVLGRGLAFPRSTRDLKLMQTLETVTIKGWRKYSIGRRRKNKFGLRFLHRLGVVQLDESQKNDLGAILKELSYLESLSLCGEDGILPIDLFAKDSCLDNVASLELHGKLPSERYIYRCLSNLTRLVLWWTEIDQRFLNDIGMLPNLAELEMAEKSYQGTRVDMCRCSQRFNSLLVLRIHGLASLEHVTVPMAIDLILSGMEGKIDRHEYCSSCNPTGGQQATGPLPPTAAAADATGGRQATGGPLPPTAAAADATGGRQATGPLPPTAAAADATGGQQATSPLPPTAAAADATGGQQAIGPLHPSAAAADATGAGGNHRQAAVEQQPPAPAAPNATIEDEIILEAMEELVRMDKKTNKSGIQRYIKNKKHEGLVTGNDLKNAISVKLAAMVESRQLFLTKTKGGLYHKCDEPQH